jgi:2-polyprenyl-3-methyl-5-hydroxy-6-metoxy-1,4-benzoquinol methylase
MLEECGHKVDLYDKFYAQNDAVFQNRYDFITATEVVEHLSSPLKDLEVLVKILHKDGILAIMTEIVLPQLDFTSWYYKNDPSHLCFYSEKTFVYLANLLGLEIVALSERVIILKKGLKPKSLRN